MVTDGSIQGVCRTYFLINMKKIGLKKWILWLSVVGNVLLLLLLVFIGGVKTNYFKSKLVQYGFLQMNDREREDYYSIKGWTNTLRKLNIDVDVVFFGNSITCGSSFEQYFPDVKICNLGYPGDGTKRMLLRVEQIKEVNPEKVFLMAGVNGLASQSIQEFSRGYKALVDSIVAVLPDAEIYLQSILPVNTSIRGDKKLNNDKIKRCNAFIQEYAKQKECIYIDLYNLYVEDDMMPAKYTKDGLHLNPEAYNIWADEIKKYL